MSEMTEAYDWLGRTLLDVRGEKLGQIDAVYPNEGSRPTWARVNMGLFGSRSVFVPVETARPTGEDVQVQIERGLVNDAPAIAAEHELSFEQEASLRRHYGFEQQPDPANAAAITRSEEELHIETTWRPHSRVRVHKYIVTEMVTTTVPVSREEIRLEHEPVSGADAAPVPYDGSIAEPLELILHEEQLVIEKRVVAVERVRLRKDTVTEHQRVSDTVRKEQVETSVEGGG